MALFDVTLPSDSGPGTTEVEVDADDFIADSRGVHFVTDGEYVAYFPRVVAVLRHD